MTWLRALESTHPFKTASRNSWETVQLSKMLCGNVPLTVQQFGHSILSPNFPAALSFLNLLKAPFLFGEYFIFFPMILKTEYLITLVNSNAASREPLIIFCCFNGISVNLTEEHDHGNMSNGLNLVYACCYSSLSTNHIEMSHQAQIYTFYASNSWVLLPFWKIMQNFILMQNT